MPKRAPTVLRRASEAELDRMSTRQHNPEDVEASCPDFRRCDFSRFDLRHQTLSEANFRGSSFRRADLSNTNFCSTDFLAADLRGTNMIGAMLADSWFGKASLKGANLAGACLYQADLRGTDLREAILDWADLEGVRVNNTTKVLPEQLTLARNVPETLLRVAKTYAANHPHIESSQALYKRETESRTKPSKQLQALSRLHPVTQERFAERLEIAKRNNEEGQFETLDLSGLNLRNAKLSSARFNGSHLRGTDLSGAELKWCDFIASDLTGATFIGADLSCATFYGATLRDTDFSDTTLNEADLRGADLRRAILKGTSLDAATCDLNTKVLPSQLKDALYVPPELMAVAQHFAATEQSTPARPQTGAHTARLGKPRKRSR